jgi:hypothetical protein
MTTALADDLAAALRQGRVAAVYLLPAAEVPQLLLEVATGNAELRPLMDAFVGFIGMVERAIADDQRADCLRCDGRIAADNFGALALITLASPPRGGELGLTAALCRDCARLFHRKKDFAIRLERRLPDFGVNTFTVQ